MPTPVERYDWVMLRDTAPLRESVVAALTGDVGGGIGVTVGSGVGVIDGVPFGITVGVMVGVG
jgi:hypothetical protein